MHTHIGLSLDAKIDYIRKDKLSLENSFCLQRYVGHCLEILGVYIAHQEKQMPSRSSVFYYFLRVGWLQEALTHSLYVVAERELTAFTSVSVFYWSW